MARSCGLMATMLILATSLTAFSGLVVHVKSEDSIDCDNDDVGSFEGGADNKEVRMDVLDDSGTGLLGSVTTNGGITGVITSGELRGVLSRSFGDSESMLSMPLSCSKET